MLKYVCFWAFAIYLFWPITLSQAADNLIQGAADIRSATGVQESAPPAEEMLTLPQARLYMLSLINRDRVTVKSPPVELDQTACVAGQLHSDAMGTIHFNSHWHPDGTKPPQRYTECGGFDYDMENSHGTGECPPFTISVAEKQLFTRREIEKEEATYFDEKPPNDGHRRNILDPAHTHVGLGLTLVELKVKYEPDGGEDIDRQLVSAQEFINKRASQFIKSDKYLSKGKTYTLSGELDPDVTFHSFQVAWEPSPELIALAVLKDHTQAQYHGGYTLPTNQVMAAFPPPYMETPNAKVSIDGRKFSCAITPAKDWHAGLYYITIWATVHGASEPQPISMQTVLLQ